MKKQQMCYNFCAGLDSRDATSFRIRYQRSCIVFETVAEADCQVKSKLLFVLIANVTMSNI